MKRKGLLLALVLLLAPAMLMAQPGPMHGKKMMHGAKMMIGEKIRSILTDEQAKKWDDIRIRYAKERNELKAKLKNARLDLHQILSAQRVPDEKKLYAKLDEIQRLENQLKRNRIAQQIEFRKLITDEQWDKLKEMKKKGMKRMMEHRAHRMHPQMPPQQ